MIESLLDNDFMNDLVEPSFINIASSTYLEDSSSTYLESSSTVLEESSSTYLEDSSSTFLEESSTTDTEDVSENYDDSEMSTDFSDISGETMDYSEEDSEETNDENDQKALNDAPTNFNPEESVVVPDFIGPSIEMNTSDFAMLSLLFSGNPNPSKSEIEYISEDTEISSKDIKWTFIKLREKFQTKKGET